MNANGNDYGNADHHMSIMMIMVIMVVMTMMVIMNVMMTALLITQS